MKLRVLFVGFLFSCNVLLCAELMLSAVIGDHMVLQQKQANPVWGWDTPDTTVTVAFAGQVHRAVAGPDGKWSVKLDPLPANATPQTLVVIGTSRREIRDVLVGEVWMCSGQSNMQWLLEDSHDGDLELAAANDSGIRVLKVYPRLGTQELQRTFSGGWKPVTPEAVRQFSAVGYRFGRILRRVLGVPIGLIDNSWGGSHAEAWVRRATLERDPRFRRLLAAAVKQEAAFQAPDAAVVHAAAMAEWKVANEAALAAGRTPPPEPPAPAAWLAGNRRPGNIFAGSVHPALGYGLRGVIWYQGEGNAPRAKEYADLFPFLIEQWRREWGQGDFPFYWVQLADFRDEQAEPGESDWAELREAQTQALRLPNTGQAVIIDLGEGNNIHPGNKHDVAQRLARWALARDYGVAVRYRSPEFRRLEVAGDKVTVTFDCFGGVLRAFDTNALRGFAVCGADRVWHWADGKVTGPDRVELRSARVPAPVAVRYAWADNPVCNLFTADGLPVTPFRSDDFPLTTDPDAAGRRP